MHPVFWKGRGIGLIAKRPDNPRGNRWAAYCINGRPNEEGVYRLFPTRWAAVRWLKRLEAARPSAQP